MNDLRRYITILENASQDELQKYRDELKYWQNEKKKYWPISKELLAQYKDGTNTEKFNGDLYWRNKNNQMHRDGDKPAYIGRDCNLQWWKNGKLHRFSGPAVIYPSGTREWHWRGEHIPVNSQEEFIEYLKKHKGVKIIRANKP